MLLCFAVSVLFGPVIVGSEPASFDTLATEYKRDIHPLLTRFCLECHSSEKKEGELDLQRFAALAEIRRGTKVWLKVAEMLDNGEMPPEDAEQPSPEQRKKLRAWVERYLYAEALAGAGDPGPVVLRRLTNAEYTYTIRDLTGVDLNPAAEFPTEGAAGEGFTNAGNALVMSPGLLRRYLDAGKEIAAHAVLLPDGFRFSPNKTPRDWTDEKLAEIRAFYGDFSVVERLADHYGHGMSHLGNAGRIPLERYFAATLAERDSLAAGDKTVEAVAAERGLNAKYLSSLWSMLTGDNRSLLLDDLRSRWHAAKPEDAPALAAHIATWQKGLWTFNPVGLLGRKGYRSRWMEAASPLLSQHEMRFQIPAPKEGEEAQEFVLSLIAGDAGDGSEHDFVVWTQPRLVQKEESDVLLHGWLTADGKPLDAASVCVRAPAVITIRVPAELAGRELVTTAALEPITGAEGSVQVDLVAGTPEAKSVLLPSEFHVKFEHVNIGADKRTVSYRRPILVNEKSEAQKRFLAAFNEFHNLFPAAICYTQIVPVDELLTLTLLYREDDHLARLMLDEDQAVHLDKLWDELRYVSREPLRVIDVLDSLLETTIDHPQAGIFDDAVKSFKERADGFRKKVVASEAKHLDALVAFTSKVWRRPLSDGEQSELRRLYDRLRELELPHEEAFRLTLARVFVASPFLYRLEEAPDGTDAAPVSDLELASRLSYFLWSSMPDEELRAAAASGTLQEPAVLIEQTQRMLKDPRVRRLATEFSCQWLHIHEFDPLQQKSEKTLPGIRRTPRRHVRGVDPLLQGPVSARRLAVGSSKRGPHVRQRAISRVLRSAGDRG
jgi:AraC-like DNA-binding protein